MPTAARLAVCAVLLIATAILVGCTKPIPMPDLGERYDRTAQYHGPDRNPVIVIPGILGSKLTHPPTGTRVWGAFERSAADPGTPEGARLIALPMEMGKPLNELTDDVEPDGSLDTVRLSLFGLPIELQAYAQILGTLGVGGYIDDQLGENGAIDYGTDHYSCFQFDYDWRRDNVENAHKLLEFIQTNRKVVQRNLAEDYGGNPEDYDVKFDIVAHSMGGLLTRYMLRYGDADLPEDGSTLEVTWAGAEHVDRVVLVGTPNAGSISALVQLVDGTKFSPLHSGYSAAVLGTMPSIYQLLPRDRHMRILGPLHGRTEIDEQTGDYSRSHARRIIRPLHFADWQEYNWGLASPKQDAELAKLLPDVEDAAERRAIALDHLEKSLLRAEQFHAALDSPQNLPSNISLTLYAGDGVPTHDIANLDWDGRITNLTQSSGDGTVTRESAVMDERLGTDWQPHLVTPIDWTDVNFLFTDHLGLTADPVFADNVLYLLLESPKTKQSR
ncbi:lipase family alpha/beta hydrolase [Algisphaera agarilytica]|uniref:Pimeloyl-ACP methyl ester carboxylesterase n=1 Tax=Algisphaera agarilytica TaxID=1385975 RepID=A0A7X0LLQ1_9BACT|nr:hypothetical protein [Algisphaera agarilytica]MBB6430203.1 pimeloyl-ACP methyl ester carboxylesterase [Algisphaera agarilytica]